jgi:hypothetical protein
VDEGGEASSLGLRQDTGWMLYRWSRFDPSAWIRPDHLMEPLFKSLVVALVPQPRQMPPSPFEAEDLQRVYMDVTRSYSYQQFGYLPGDLGAQLINAPDDMVLLQPGVFQVTARMDGSAVLTTDTARAKVISILRTASSRLKVDSFLQCTIRVVAHVGAPGPVPDAKAYVSEQLMGGSDQAAILGGDYFGGGIRFRRVAAGNSGEESLNIEPFLQDNTFIFVQHDISRTAAPQAINSLDQVATWIEEAFEFVTGPSMSLLEAQSNAA